MIPCNVLLTWDEDYDEPLYLISNYNDPIAIKCMYISRFGIECCFRDMKLHGHCHFSNFKDRAREKLWLAVIGMIFYIRLLAVKKGKDLAHKFARQYSYNRNDLSFSELGRHLIEAKMKKYSNPLLMLKDLQEGTEDTLLIM